MPEMEMKHFSVNRPWIYLVYLGLFFFPWSFQPPTLGEALISLISMTGFIVVYVVVMTRMDAGIYLAAICALAVGFSFIPFNLGGGVFIVFAATMIAWLPRTRFRDMTLLALGLSIGIISWLMGLSAVFVSLIYINSALAVGGAMMSARHAREEANSEIRKSQFAMLGAEEERHRIARDLHDLLGHTLSVVTLKADLASRVFDTDSERARTELADIQTISRHALTEVREAVMGLQDRDLERAVDEARKRLEDVGFSVSLVTDPVRLTRLQATTLSMVIREATTNILRHSNAKQVEIEIVEMDNEVRLSVSDDGKGGAHRSQGGLGGLSSRLKEMSGRLQIEAGLVPGKGTSIIASLPVQEI